MVGFFDQYIIRPSHVKTEEIETDDETETELAETETAVETTPTTARALKEAVQELLKYGLLEQQRKPNLYSTALQQQSELNRILEPFDLASKIDDIRGLVFLIVAEPDHVAGQNVDEEWTHPLIRRQRLTLEQSLLVAILRQEFVAHEQEAGIGNHNAKVTLETLNSQLKIYLGELGSDRKEMERLRRLLEQLKTHGLVSEIDPQEQVFIRPIIAHVANPENLTALLQAFKQEAVQDTH